MEENEQEEREKRDEHYRKMEELLEKMSEEKKQNDAQPINKYIEILNIDQYGLDYNISAKSIGNSAQIFVGLSRFVYLREQIRIKAAR